MRARSTSIRVGPGAQGLERAMTWPPTDSGNTDRRTSSLDPATIVVGLSHAAAGLEALRFGITEARHRGTPLRAVRVFGFDPPWVGPDVARFQAGFALCGHSLHP